MSTTEPIQIPIEGNATDFIAAAKNVNASLDKMAAHTKTAGTTTASSMKGAAISITDLRSAYMIAADAARVAGQVWQATGQEFVDYAEQVKNMSRSLGASAEETSRLIQVADDVRLSYDSLKMAMKMAQKEGIEPNIENLAKLSDQYLALPPGVERTKFAIEKFGNKAGPEMEKLLVKGGKAIKDYSAAIGDNLIIDEKAIAASDKYQKSLDNLKDTLAGMAIGAGAQEVGPLTNALININIDLETFNKRMKLASDGVAVASKSFDELTGSTIETNKYTKILYQSIGSVMDDMVKGIASTNPLLKVMYDTWKLISPRVDDTTKAVENFIPAADDSAAAIDTQKEAVEAAKDALKDYQDALDDVSQSNKDMESMSRTIAKDQRQYEDDHKDAVDEVADLERELADAREKYSEDFISNAKKVGFAQKDLNDAIKQYGANSEEAFNAREKLNDAKGAQDVSFKGLDETFTKLGEAQGAVTDLEVAWHEAANNMIYDMVLVGLSAGGLLDSEQKALDEYAVKVGIKTQADIDEANRRREIADSTIAGILQSEDVLAEQRTVDAETLRLETAITSEEAVAANLDQASSVDNVTASIDSAILSYQGMARAAEEAAQAAATIPTTDGGSSGGGSSGSSTPMHSQDSGGTGMAGVPYMIGRGAQPEIFIPQTNGTFIPNADKKGFGGTTYNINITNAKPESSENSIRTALKNLQYLGVAE